MADEAGARPDLEAGRHPIQIVSDRTGLAPDRIRQWERRYSVVAPDRSDGGHRLYSDLEVERLRLLATLVGGGRRIGDVAELETEELARMVDEDREAVVDAPRPETGDRRTDYLVEACVARILQLDASGLEALLRRTAATLGLREFIVRLVAPLLARIGQDWEAGVMRASHEHLATPVLRKVLGELSADASVPTLDGPRLVVATPQGAAHELGALMIASLAAGEGWSVTYLGADLPWEDIGWAAGEAGASAVALSLVHPAADPAVEQDLRALRSSLPDNTPLLLGGQAAGSYRAALSGTNTAFPGLQAFPSTLRSFE